MTERNERPIFEGQSRRLDERRAAERRQAYRREEEQLSKARRRKLELIFVVLKYLALIVFITVYVKFLTS
jgi:hypothetical protein